MNSGAISSCYKRVTPTEILLKGVLKTIAINTDLPSIKLISTILI
jgi:hypothetical protein